MAIDTPWASTENRCLYSALLTSACEADVVIALVLNADAQWSPFRVYRRPDEPPGRSALGSPAPIRRPAAYFAGCGMAYAGWRPADFINTSALNTRVRRRAGFSESKEPLCLTK